MHVHPAGPVSDTNVVFAGTVSLRVMVVAAPGPPLVTVCENVMFWPAFTGFGLPELVTLRSACPAVATPTFTVAELSLGFVSDVAEAAVAVSVIIVPAPVPAFTVTTTGKVLDEPGATLGLVQLIDPAVVQVHPAGTGVSDTNVVFAGNASVKVALVQLLGPLLVTTCV